MQTRCLDAEAHRERNLREPFESAEPGDRIAGDQAEEDLRSGERPPIDVLLKKRIHDAKDAVQQAGPEHGRDDASEQDGPLRPDGQQGAIEKADQQRGRSLDDIGGDEGS